MGILDCDLTKLSIQKKKMSTIDNLEENQNDY